MRRGRWLALRSATADTLLWVQCGGVQGRGLAGSMLWGRHAQWATLLWVSARHGRRCHADVAFARRAGSCAHARGWQGARHLYRVCRGLQDRSWPARHGLSVTRCIQRGTATCAWPAYLVSAFSGWCMHHKLSAHSFGLQGFERPTPQPKTPVRAPACLRPMQGAEYTSTPSRQCSLLRTCVEYGCTYRLACPLLAGSGQPLGGRATCIHSP